MEFARLTKTSFFRKYENIGYLYNEITRKDLVLDESGAVFVSEIGREPTEIPATSKRIAARFIASKPAEVEKDFKSLLKQLAADGFVVVGNSRREIDANEPRFSYSTGVPRNPFPESLEESQLPSSELLKEHFAKYPRLFSMQIELTSYCNLKCVHCYLGDIHAAAGMPIDKVFNLLDQLRDMGTMKVTFTGGEALSRPDLPEILRHARRNDLSIALLTNNVLLTDSLLEEIKSIGVGIMQISVYSMRSEVHDAITRQPGSWERTIRNIEKLVAHDVPVQIACPIMKGNLDSFSEVIEWGKKMRIRAKPDIVLMARTDFLKDNLDHRLSMEESEKAIKSILASDVEYQEKLRLKDKIKKRIRPDDPVCGIGTSMMCMAANGDFYPCPGMQMKLGSIECDSVRDVWTNSAQITELRKVKRAAYPKCLKCQSLEYCIMCPAKFHNESGGDIYNISNHFCGVSHLNRKIAEDYLMFGKT